MIAIVICATVALAAVTIKTYRPDLYKRSLIIMEGILLALTLAVLIIKRFSIGPSVCYLLLVLLMMIGMIVGKYRPVYGFMLVNYVSYVSKTFLLRYKNVFKRRIDDPPFLVELYLLAIVILIILIIIL